MMTKELIESRLLGLTLAGLGLLGVVGGCGDDDDSSVSPTVAGDDDATTGDDDATTGDDDDATTGDDDATTGDDDATTGDDDDATTGDDDDATTGDDDDATTGDDDDTIPVNTPTVTPGDDVVPADVGDVVVTEIQASSRTVYDSNAKWIEIKNVTETKTFDIDGWIVALATPGVDTVPTHLISTPTPFLLGPGEVLVLGRSTNAYENGNANVDYAWGSFSDDAMSLETGFTVTLYQPASSAIGQRQDLAVDSVFVDTAGGTWPRVDGVSYSLDRDHTDAVSNDSVSFWCLSHEPMAGSGDTGTPGMDNPLCGTDEDGDLYGSTWDCLDSDANVNPGAPEIEGNEIDDDCDGVTDEVLTFHPGDLIITEVMYNPTDVSDTNGEWFELYNATDSVVDLQGFVIGDLVSYPDYHVIMKSVLVQPSDFAVLGVNDDPSSNGGVLLDYEYPRFGLNNDYDEVAGVADAVYLYFDNVLLDTVEWDAGHHYPVANGESLNLSSLFFDDLENDVPTHWCLATVSYGTGANLGTPGEANDECPPDADEDGYLEGDDCDDSDPLVNPSMDEVAGNSKDDDCDGVIDEVTPAPGVVIITEIMMNPKSSPDENAEYLELYNTTEGIVTLNGWTLKDEGSDEHLISSDTPIAIPAHSYFILAKSSDPSANGGVTSVGYAYGNSYTLANSDDEIQLFSGDVLVDEVKYNKSGTPAWTVPEGKSLQLDPTQFSAEANDVPTAWCTSTTPIAENKDLGTPGLANTACGS